MLDIVNAVVKGLMKYFILGSRYCRGVTSYWSENIYTINKSSHRDRGTVRLNNRHFIENEVEFRISLCLFLDWFESCWTE